jgi:hypothetical protein
VSSRARGREKQYDAEKYCRKMEKMLDNEGRKKLL